LPDAFHDLGQKDITPMTTVSATRAVLVVALALGPAVAAAQEAAGSPENPVDTMHAVGTFDVKLAAQSTDAAPLARQSLDKEFRGDLTGTSRGEMLAYRSAVDGSAGYVAMEVVTGTLSGRSGTFVLQHSGTMNRGTQHLELTVVPDSGTDELEGLAGSMRIIIEGGAHSYELDYTLPD
jgi:hypothetical protein